MLGWPVGDTVGFSDDAVGFALGLFDGVEVVGEAVGFAVGSLVGLVE